MKNLLISLFITAITLTGADDCRRHDTSAGSAGGGSAGNSQPDGGMLQMCSMPGDINIDPVSYVERAGVVYVVSVYLMNESDCDVIDTDPDKVLRVTLVATDATGLRLEPKHNSFQSSSPYSAAVAIAFPKDFSISVVGAVSLTALEKETLDAGFIGCQIVPTGGGDYPKAARLEFIDKGNVECLVSG